MPLVNKDNPQEAILEPSRAFEVYARNQDINQYGGRMRERRVIQMDEIMYRCDICSCFGSRKYKILDKYLGLNFEKLTPEFQIFCSKCCNHPQAREFQSGKYKADYSPKIRGKREFDSNGEKIYYPTKPKVYNKILTTYWDSYNKLNRKKLDRLDNHINNGYV